MGIKRQSGFRSVALASLGVALGAKSLAPAGPTDAYKEDKQRRSRPGHLPLVRYTDCRGRQRGLLGHRGAGVADATVLRARLGIGEGHRCEHPPHLPFPWK